MPLTYRCGTAFSVMVVVETKAVNKLMNDQRQHEVLSV